MAGWDLPATPALAPGAGNLTAHLRELDGAGYLVVRKEFRDLKLARWLQAPAGGPGRTTISAASRPLPLWGEVDLHFK